MLSYFQESNLPGIFALLVYMYPRGSAGNLPGRGERRRLDAGSDKQDCRGAGTGDRAWRHRSNGGHKKEHENAVKTEFHRTDNLFSLCGLNCGLCPMKKRGDCGGCFSDSPRYPTCPIAPCSVKHGNVHYCFEYNERQQHKCSFKESR